MGPKWDRIAVGLLSVLASRQGLAGDAAGPSSARRDSRKLIMLQPMNPSATAGSFVMGNLEDWTNGALHFNGVPAGAL